MGTGSALNRGCCASESSCIKWVERGQIVHAGPGNTRTCDLQAAQASQDELLMEEAANDALRRDVDRYQRRADLEDEVSIMSGKLRTERSCLC